MKGGSIPLSKLRHRLHNSFFAGLDQGALSASNFIVSIGLARLVSPTEYGAFAVSSAMMLFVSGFNNALVIEPACVLASKASALTPSRYLSAVLGIQVLLTGCLSLVMVLVTTLIVQKPVLRSALISAAISLSFVTLFWMLRRTAYVWFKAKQAAVASVVYAVVLLGCFWMYRYRFPLDATVPFTLMSVASIFSAAYLLFIGRRTFWNAKLPRLDDLRQLWTSHLDYGRWIVYVALLTFFTESMYPVLLDAGHGLGESATYRMAENFMTPVTQAGTAFSVLLLPAVARKIDREGASIAQSSGLKLGALTTICAVILLGTIIFSCEWLAKTFYRSVPDGFLGIVTILASVVGLRLVSDMGLALPLKALGNSQAIFWGSITASIAAAMIGIVLTVKLGITGAALSRLIAVIVQSLTLFFCFRKSIRERGQV